MKKNLLIIGMLCLSATGFGQIVLNEVYTEPGNSGARSEFIELYNSSNFSLNLDCFTIMTYWETGANKGWYVIDLPSTVVLSKKWYVVAAANPFNVQSTSGVIPNENWNAMPATGYLKKYQLCGSSYTEVVAGTVTDLLVDASPAGSNGHNYFTFLLKNGVFINGFWGGGPTGTLPSGIKTMPSLTIPSMGTCAASYNINFSGFGMVDFVNQSPGSDNGYERTSDGICGVWAKTSAGISHTPGLTNGTAAATTGSLTTAQFLSCSTGPGVSTVTYNITGFTGSVTQANDFPVVVQLYYDNGTIPGQLDSGDTYQSSQTDLTIADPAKTFTISEIEYVILVYKTQRSCFDKVFALANGCAVLPVRMTFFTATRENSVVVLKWQTAFEQRSAGFAIERNMIGSWEQIAFVPTQAVNGSGNQTLDYHYSDLNSGKGITQYRIRQVDIDNTSRYSEIRAVRASGQNGKTMVYPNPSNNGSVSVVFESGSTGLSASLFDITGRVIREWKIVSGNILEINNLNSGFYSLRIMNKVTGVHSVERIVVNRL